MNLATDMTGLQELGTSQKGVFSRADLQTLFAERHAQGFKRRVDALLAAGLLRRFARGWYVTRDFDLPTLSQRLCSSATVSFGRVLADALLIGPRPVQAILCTRLGTSRRYEGLGFTVEHVRVSDHLDVGVEVRDGVRWATPEKAMLDCLYFHLRGRKYTFDPFSDVQIDRLDRTRLTHCLGRYRNPRFVAFARDVLELD